MGWWLEDPNPNPNPNPNTEGAEMGWWLEDGWNGGLSSVLPLRDGMTVLLFGAALVC
jgi:hypothetical protein